MTRIGIIGLGFGVAVHLPAFRGLEEVQVVALGGRRKEKARQLATEYGLEVGGSVDDVLKSDLDAVSVALPPADGAAVVEQALDKGLAVLAEKPLADNVERALVLADKARGRTTAVDFELAELDSFRELKRRMGSERVQRLNVRWVTRSFAHSQRKWSWKLDQTRHGGVMSLLGSHVLYLTEWLLGPIAELRAEFFSQRSRAIAPASARPAEDRALLQAVTATDIPVEMELDNASEGDGLRWDITVSDGLFVVSETPGGTFTLRYEPASGSLAIPIASDLPGSKDWRIRPFSRLADRFARAVASKKGSSPDFVAGLRVQRLLDAARLSASTGHETAVREA